MLRDDDARRGEKWVVVAREVPGRDDVQCRQRWNLSLDPNTSRGPWTPEEDGFLLASHADAKPNSGVMLPGKSERGTTNNVENDGCAYKFVLLHVEKECLPK